MSDSVALPGSMPLLRSSRVLLPTAFARLQIDPQAERRCGVSLDAVETTIINVDIIPQHGPSLASRSKRSRRKGSFATGYHDDSCSSQPAS